MLSSRNPPNWRQLLPACVLEWERLSNGDQGISQKRHQEVKLCCMKDWSWDQERGQNQVTWLLCLSGPDSFLLLTFLGAFDLHFSISLQTWPTAGGLPTAPAVMCCLFRWQAKPTSIFQFQFYSLKVETVCQHQPWNMGILELEWEFKTKKKSCIDRWEMFSWAYFRSLVIDRIAFKLSGGGFTLLYNFPSFRILLYFRVPVVFNTQ